MVPTSVAAKSPEKCRIISRVEGANVGLRETRGTREVLLRTAVFFVAGSEPDNWVRTAMKSKGRSDHYPWLILGLDCMTGTISFQKS